MIPADIRRGAMCELARRDFFFYCKLKAPDFYTDDRKFLVDFCNQLQEFYFSDERVLVVNMPPRHGKSRTISCFVEWALGRDQTLKVMTGSYNETLSTNFSKNVRNTISEVKADADRIIWSDIFPGITIRRGDGAMNIMWSPVALRQLARTATTITLRLHRPERRPDSARRFSSSTTS